MPVGIQSPAMTDALPDSSNPGPSGRARLLRFLLPVLAAHALLLGVLPFWPAGDAGKRRVVDVELAGTTAVEAEASAPAPPAVEPPPPAPAEAALPPAASITTRRGTETVAESPEPASGEAPATLPEAPPRQVAPAVTPTTESRDEIIGRAPADALPAAAATASTSAPQPAWRDSYRDALRTALARHHHYPARARRFGLTGEVLVAFSIDRDGSFHDIHVARSSEAELLDQAALATVQRLGRFRPLPATYSEDSWAVSVPLVYRLN